MKPRLYLVDAHAYLHRAYHALPPLTDSKKRPVGALYGFARTLLQILRDRKPDAMAVCFDRPEPTFRHKAYAEYKATRKEIDPELIDQLKRALPLAETLGFKCVEKAGFEADDIMATLSRKARAADWDVVLVTGDKDALQLIEPGVRVLNISKNAWFDAPQVEEKFGVPPAQVRDYLAIVGDASDNVPGVKGVGPVGAVKLLKSYGSLKAAIAAAKKGDKDLTPKVVGALRDAEKTADLSLSLIALEMNVPLDIAPEDCRIVAPDPQRAAAGLERAIFFFLLHISSTTVYCSSHHFFLPIVPRTNGKATLTGTLAVAMALVMTLIAVEYRIIGRPEMFSHLFTVVFLYLLWQRRKQPSSKF